MKKEFTPGQEIYYRNQHSIFLKDIDGNKCVIEVPYEAHYGDESYTEYGTLIVFYDQLSTSKIDFNEEFNSLKEKLRVLESSKTTEISLKVRELEKEYSELMKKLKAVEPIKQLMEYLEGNSKYAVIQDYNDYKLLEMSELTTDDESRWNHTRLLKAFVINRQEKNKFYFTISSYSDGSGSTKPLFLFDKKEDAINKYVELMKEKIKNTKSCIVDERVLTKWEIKDPDLLANVELGKKQRKENRLKEIEQKAYELEKLRAQYCELEK